MREEIEQLERSLRMAMLSGDTGKLDQMTASDFVWTHSSGKVETKPAWLDRSRSIDRRYTKLDTSGVEVRAYGNTVLVAGRLDLTYVSGAGSIDVPLRFMRVWVRLEGSWRLAAHNSTLLPA